MRLFSRTTRWAALGLLLSTISAGCASTSKPVPAVVPAAEPTVVVRTVKDAPPSELTRCPAAPEGLPAEGIAQIPPAWRAAIIRLARAYGAEHAQLGRLIGWNTGEACP